MSDKLKISLELSEHDVKQLVLLLDILTFNKDYKNLPFEYLEPFEKLAFKLDKELENFIINKEISKRLDNPGTWKDLKCKTCGHKGRDHALGGTGLCVSEGCPCWKFQE